MTKTTQAQAQINAENIEKGRAMMEQLAKESPAVDFTAPVEVFTFGKTPIHVFYNSELERYECYVSRKADGQMPLKVSHSPLKMYARRQLRKDGTPSKKAPALLETRTPEQAIAKAKNGARIELKKWSANRRWKASPEYAAIQAQHQAAQKAKAKAA